MELRKQTSARTEDPFARTIPRRHTPLPDSNAEKSTLIDYILHFEQSGSRVNVTGAQCIPDIGSKLKVENPDVPGHKHYKVNYVLHFYDQELNEATVSEIVVVCEREER